MIISNSITIRLWYTARRAAAPPSGRSADRSGADNNNTYIYIYINIYIYIYIHINMRGLGCTWRAGALEPCVLLLHSCCMHPRWDETSQCGFPTAARLAVSYHVWLPSLLLLIPRPKFQRKELTTEAKQAASKHLAVWTQLCPLSLLNTSKLCFVHVDAVCWLSTIVSVSYYFLSLRLLTMLCLFVFVYLPC